MSKTRPTSKVVREVIIEAERLGWSSTMTRNNHFRLDKKGCPPIFMPGTPSDVRSMKNVRAKLRRAEREGAKR